jgi:hypothetical protein
MSDMERDPSDLRPGDGEIARWAPVEKGVRQDIARPARLVLDCQGESYKANLLARRIDSCGPAGSAPSTYARPQSDDRLYLTAVHGDRRTRHE